MIALALLAAAAMSDAQIDKALAAAPPEVRRLAVRLEGCTHFGGEEAYDADRARQIAAEVKRLGCDRLDADEAALRRRYGARPDILRLMTAVHQRME